MGALYMAYAGAEHDVITEAAIDDVFRFSIGAARLINKSAHTASSRVRRTNIASSMII